MAVICSPPFLRFLTLQGGSGRADDATSFACNTLGGAAISVESGYTAQRLHRWGSWLLSLLLRVLLRVVGLWLMWEMTVTFAGALKDLPSLLLFLLALEQGIIVSTLPISLLVASSGTEALHLALQSISDPGSALPCLDILA